MLPFLKPKAASTTIMMGIKPDGKMESKGEEGETDMGLMSAAEDIMSAIHMKDAKALAMALKAAFEICDEMPHEEGPALPEDDE